MSPDERTEAATRSTQSIPQVIYKEAKEDYSFVLELRELDAECWIVLDVSTPNTSLDPDHLIQVLKDNNIDQKYIDEQRVNILCDMVKRGENLGMALLAKGKNMETGLNGWLEVLVSTRTDLARYDKDELDKIDYRSRHAIANVAKEMKVATLHRPQAGKAGETVFGEVIPSQHGEHFELIAADGIQLDYVSGDIFAEASGRLLFDGQSLSISDEFNVEGDVNFTVGHIEFLGFVNVQGDILDAFNIKASKGMQIEGVTGACRLEAGGDITLLSMFGKGEGVIRCTGDLHAQLLSGVQVECHGNVVVAREIRDSEIKALGHIKVSDGIISGGTCIAMQGVEAKEIGCPQEVPTKIMAGINFLDPEILTELQSQIRTIDKEVEEKQRSKSSLESQLETSEVESVGIHIKVLSKEIRKLNLAKEILEEEVRFFHYGEKVKPNPKVNAISKMHGGVELMIGDVEEKITDEIFGPISMIQNPLVPGLSKLRMSSLDFPAQRIAEKIIRDAKSE